MSRPCCLRCGKPLVLFRSFDDPNAWELTCGGGWQKDFQDDAAFFCVLENLPGDWVVRLGLQPLTELRDALSKRT